MNSSNVVSVAIAVVAVLAGGRLVQQAPGSDLPERNILLVVTDDQGKTLSCYDDPVARTPSIGALAQDGTRFLNAYATTASCSASRSVILTGLHNHKNGQYGHQHHFHKFATYPDVISLALPRVLATAGYRTARCGKFHVAPEVVYHFESVIPGPTRNPVKMAENCREFLLDRSDDRPFLLYFATSDPHRGGRVDDSSSNSRKPNLFGNLPDRKTRPGIDGEFFSPDEVPVPDYLPDTVESREELAQYYQSCERVDQGLGRLIEILREAGLYDKTLIVFTSDHGPAFAGAKSTVYEPGLRVPLVVRNPYQPNRPVVSEALVSHVDLTPTLVDFAHALDRQANGPKNWQPADKYWEPEQQGFLGNRDGGQSFRRYQGQSWIHVLGDAATRHREAIVASHTFHEIQMYYPMRVYRDRKYKLIWNVAHRLPFPFASDLWAASSWQAQYAKGPGAPYGVRTVDQYIHRPRLELYDMVEDPSEAHNLADDPAHADVLAEYQELLQQAQRELEDPWITKWEYE